MPLRETVTYTGQRPPATPQRRASLRVHHITYPPSQIHLAGEEEQEEEEDYGDSSNGDEDADEDNKDPGNSNNMASPSRSSGGEKQGNDILLIKI